MILYDYALYLRNFIIMSKLLPSFSASKLNSLHSNADISVLSLK